MSPAADIAAGSGAFCVVAACALLLGALLPRFGRPSLGAQPMGKEATMPVSKDVQDFCAAVGPAVQGFTQAAVAAALAGATTQAEADKQAAVAAAVAQVQLDHADEMAALQAALGAATGSGSAPG